VVLKRDDEERLVSSLLRGFKTGMGILSIHHMKEWALLLAPKKSID